MDYKHIFMKALHCSECEMDLLWWESVLPIMFTCDNYEKFTELVPLYFYRLFSQIASHKVDFSKVALYVVSDYVTTPLYFYRLFSQIASHKVDFSKVALYVVSDYVTTPLYFYRLFSQIASHKVDFSKVAL